MSIYSKTSPYYLTDQTAGYLDVITWRNVPSEPDDILFTVTNSYQNRPDLLAYALYGTPELWWVFAQRNMDVLQDPIFDFTAGTQIYLCKKSSLTKVLGL